MVQYYHRSLQQVYSIIIPKILGIEADLILQIFFKAINNFAGLNWLVSTLLVFDAYPTMIELDVLPPSIIQYVIAIKKVVDEIQKYIAS